MIGAASNSLLQLTQLTSPGWNLQYNFSSSQNNGKIVSQTDMVSGEQVNYAYDSLNRLASATSNQNWSQSFSYDGFGNLSTVTASNAPGLGLIYNPATNQQTTDCADLNGNVMGNASCAGSNAYGYDIENRIVLVPGGMEYNYSPGNQRLWRGGGSTDEITYWGPTGQKLATYQISVSNGALVATLTSANYYFGSKLIKNVSGMTYTDRLGSTVKTYPCGVERPSATANGKEKFAGYVRDSETGLDYSINRFEQPGMGRFLSPDLIGASGRVREPGSWNQYAYVADDPLNRIDPSGRDYCIDAGDCVPDEVCENPTSQFNNPAGWAAYCDLGFYSAGGSVITGDPGSGVGGTGIPNAGSCVDLTTCYSPGSPTYPGSLPVILGGVCLYAPWVCEVGVAIPPVGIPVLIGVIIGSTIGTGGSATRPIDNSIGGPAQKKSNVGSKPTNGVPTGTVPIDQAGLSHDQIHDVKDGIGAGPRTWVGIAPNGDVIVGDSSGQAVDEGPWTDYTHH